MLFDIIDRELKLQRQLDIIKGHEQHLDDLKLEMEEKDEKYRELTAREMELENRVIAEEARMEFDRKKMLAYKAKLKEREQRLEEREEQTLEKVNKLSDKLQVITCLSLLSLCHLSADRNSY
jgi:Skp family chaperone for outer membrane proteins